MISITVDADRCEGHGLCQDAAPEVFELDDEGVPAVLANPVPASLVRQAEAGVRVCPVAALRVHQA
jgi:ferredoxin